MRTITFNELRKIKDSLPSGSMHRIADELGLHVDTVRNFFGGHNFKEGKSVGIHLEPGPDGGLVMLDDTTVLDRALKILDELNIIDILTDEQRGQGEPPRNFHTQIFCFEISNLWHFANKPSIRKQGTWNHKINIHFHL